jgi:hypothetical protein
MLSELDGLGNVLKVLQANICQMAENPLISV